jgi:hypothetical protein
MNTKQTVYNILASAKKEPVKVELAGINDVINELKNSNLSPALSLVGEAVKQLDKASIAARKLQSDSEKRLEDMKSFIQIAKGIGIDTSDYDGFLAMAQAHVKKAADAAKRIESASGTAKLAYD